ncbi:L-prolyl-PCP dehydrogenase [Methylomarinovum caldicuralii]|uniref:L-prolyl-PCP dehydrogenase n=1 Tax=Methylomarinovum caldicuralii TaxID=438856 RepID=A0AAU9CGY3_9GAMM|nr:acyl-CoA dehydrogenase family protein [Methylomarinovum caldicuralii]BCX80836.1 L-prolyl-PCP dehydrogenase [Methylomarinovum caldicuralii]
MAMNFYALGRTGLFRHAVPESWGGLGDGFAGLLQAHIRLGRESRDPGLVLAAGAHLWGALFPLLRHGDDAQRNRWLPQLVSGQWLGGHAITEPQGGSDPAAMTARAVRCGEGFRLDGEKYYITNVPAADLLIVYARLDGAVSAFVVLKDDPGAHYRQDYAVAACRSAPMGEVVLEDCRLPAGRLLGRPGAGLALIQQALEWERAFIFAGIAGVMEWQLEQVIAFSRKRRSGAAHLGRHQAVAHRIADMRTRLDTVHLWLRECARLADAGLRLTLASAQTKLVASRAFLESTLDAVHILGARGLEEAGGMSAWLNDAAAGRLFSGSDEVLKNLIAALLGTGEGYRPGIGGSNPQSRQ